MSDQRGGQLVTEGQLEPVVGRFRLFSTAGGFVRGLVAIPLALLAELLVLFGLGLCPSVMIVRDGHIEPIDASILGGVLRAPDVLLSILLDGVSLLGYLPGGAMSLCLGVPSTASFSTSTVLLSIAREAHLLCQLAKLLLDVLEGRGEGNDFCVLLIRDEPVVIGNHVPMHLIQLEDDFCWVRDFLHDPVALNLINKV